MGKKADSEALFILLWLVGKVVAEADSSSPMRPNNEGDESYKLVTSMLLDGLSAAYRLFEREVEREREADECLKKMR